MQSYKESNWYVLQVYENQEERIKNKCLELISKDLLTYAFVPKNERLVRHKKVLKKVENVLFPGYVFLETEDIKSLYIEVSNIKEFKKFIAKDDEFIHPILEFEKMSILKYVDEDYIARLSKGFKEGDKVIITEGPLKDHSADIKKIIRKKHKALVDIELLGHIVEMELGLEVINKYDEVEEE